MLEALDTALNAAFLSSASHQLQHRPQPNPRFNIHARLNATRLQLLEKRLHLPQQVQALLQHMQLPPLPTFQLLLRRVP